MTYTFQYGRQTLVSRFSRLIGKLPLLTPRRLFYSVRPIRSGGDGMDLITAMKARRSTRAFLSREVTKKSIQTILDAARWAPSGVNM